MTTEYSKNSDFQDLSSWSDVRGSDFLMIAAPSTDISVSYKATIDEVLKHRTVLENNIIDFKIFLNSNLLSAINSQFKKLGSSMQRKL